MKRKSITVLVASLVVCGLVWNQERRGQLVLRDGEAAPQVYWAIITRWRGQMEIAAETPAHSYVRVATNHFPSAVF